MAGFCKKRRAVVVILIFRLLTASLHPAEGLDGMKFVESAQFPIHVFLLPPRRWLEKEPLAKSSLERTWLFHEIGRCYLELKNHEGARDYGLKSLASAEKAGDQEWKMNSNVLVAQAEFKLGNLHKALTFFEKALEKASLLNDDAAQVAISNAAVEAKSLVTGSSS
ncbi:outer dynein arm-docking complex subunit 4-like, partial [Hypanus sabinus]|uniref:outer dynein arm-docking complex subunit 4-like n=1 Tax=Hypanus sabinus TaxID=79690 RepID=UPI0028C3F146